MSAARQKKGIFGLHRAKAGQTPRRRSRHFRSSSRETFLESKRRVPTGAINVMSLRAEEPAGTILEIGCDGLMPPAPVITTS